jgi:hypothetical protein
MPDPSILPNTATCRRVRKKVLADAGYRTRSSEEEGARMMTEEQWLSGNDPADMLRHIRRCVSSTTPFQLPVWFAYYKQNRAPRKMRLFLLACCFRVCQGSTDPLNEEFLKVVERYVETPPPLMKQDNVLAPFAVSPGYVEIVHALWRPIGHAAADLRQIVARSARTAAGRGQPGADAERAARENEAREQCRLLRDIFNPFHPLLSREAKATRDQQRKPWLRWNGGAVRGLVQDIYEAKAFDRLPILGDALEEAGCIDTPILDHCRLHGPHVRGCWVLDLLLGKS